MGALVLATIMAFIGDRVGDASFGKRNSMIPHEGFGGLVNSSYGHITLDIIQVLWQEVNRLEKFYNFHEFFLAPEKIRFSVRDIFEDDIILDSSNFFIAKS